MHIEVQQALSAINLAVLAVAMAVFLLALAKGRIELYAAIAPLVWLLHGTIFYIAVMARTDTTPTVFFTSWSSVLRLQAAITVLAAALVELWRNGHSD